MKNPPIYRSGGLSTEQSSCLRRPGLLHTFFEERVDLHPDNTAVVFNGQAWTYLDVEKRANRLARHLKTKNIGPGQLVALLLERSERQIIALLAVLKAGAGYVPLDPDYPDERIAYMLEHAGIETVVTEVALANRIERGKGHIVLLDEEDLVARHSSERLPAATSRTAPEDICYVIYTSGTTGRPKGVVTEHRNACCFVESFAKVCRLTAHDRVYQGFSLGFDGSVEEIWMAFSAGAALVIADRKTSKLGSEAARLITQERVSYFSTVPTFLSLIREELPTVKLLVVSGEVCTPELVARWATPARRMLNVYGPTEATVNTTVAECSPGAPVTVGKPLPGYEIYVLGPDLQPVAQGEHGELFVGGPGISRGYLNQPELTAGQFVTTPDDHPLPGKRLYRTGDLARQEQDGDLLFLGRIDSQVKIRGFRIEITEIEAILSEHPQVEDAAVKVVESEGLKQLAAFVTLIDSRAVLDRDSVLELAKHRLPHYMVPACLEVLDKMPTLTSGKIDRQRLPDRASPLIRESRTIAEPATELERRVVAVFEEVFNICPLSVEDDFFVDLGGYSLLAARAVTRLREELDLDVAIRDIYDQPTARRLATRLQQRRYSVGAAAGPEASRQNAEEVFHSVSRGTRAACYTLQAASLTLFYGLGTGVFAVYLLLGLSCLRGDISLETALLVGIAFGLAIYPSLLLFIFLSKWLLIGRFRPGRYPLWSFYYFRWWFVTRLQAFSGIGAFAGTPVINLYLRLMGARIGRNTIIDSPFCSTFDLISIGDDSSIGSETHFSGYRVEDGMLILGHVTVGKGCCIGIHSNLGLNVTMEDGSSLGDLSMLPDYTTVGLNRAVAGSPARPTVTNRPTLPPYRHRPVCYGLLHILALLLLGLYLAVASLPTAALVFLAFLKGGPAQGIVALYLSVPLGVMTFCLAAALLRHLLIGRAAPGIYRVESSFYVRKWLVDRVMRISTTALRPLYTTIYLPPWLRLMGAEVGRRAEISTVSQISPELVTIAEESFFADGAIIGGRHFCRGYVEIGPSRVGWRSFVGNSAFLPIGSILGNNCLLGCLSTLPDGDSAPPDNSEWLGSPSFRLPYRKKVEGFGEEVTFRPTGKLYSQRLAVDALRILIPGMLGVTGLLGLSALVYYSSAAYGWTRALLLSPIFGVALAVFSALAVAMLKTMVMGRFDPVIKPLWSLYIWLNEMINGAYESVFAPATLPFLGTPFFAPLLRTMGCRVGKNTFIETTLFSEFDLVAIGDYAALNRGAVIQNHLFEDRIMKSDHLKIGDRCSVGNMAVILYSSEMEEGSSVGPLSLLMKGEILPARSRWQGIPIEGIQEPAGAEAMTL